MLHSLHNVRLQLSKEVHTEIISEGIRVIISLRIDKNMLMNQWREGVGQFTWLQFPNIKAPDAKKKGIMNTKEVAVGLTDHSSLRRLKFRINEAKN